jgi:Mce-associated membrane protein
LVTDGYRPTWVAQQEATRKAGAVDNVYWVTNGAVLNSTANRAVMLMLLQGQRGAAGSQRFISASVRVSFEKSGSGQWQVSDLTVLAQPKSGGSGGAGG